MNTKSMMNLISLSLGFFFLSQGHADQVTVNNNNSNPGYGRQPVVVSPCPPANQNDIYDPRVPPAGVYQSQNSTTYTTGEKKPYITDNNCNPSTAPVQPYAFVNPPKGK